jgi:hypothetical protein
MRNLCLFPVPFFPFLAANQLWVVFGESEIPKKRRAALEDLLTSAQKARLKELIAERLKDTKPEPKANPEADKPAENPPAGKKP